MSVPSPIFRMFNPGKKSKEAAAEQRREQLRRAQNTYRQRKTRYVKDLEVALTKSQQREHNLATELERLQRACQSQGISTLSSSSPPRQQGAQATSLRGVPPTARACDVDAATLGMTFVLKIEEPCLGHIHGAPDKPDDPNGHAMTATSHLLALQQQNHHHFNTEKQFSSPSPPAHRFTARFTKSSPSSSAGYTSPVGTGSTPNSSSTSSWPSPLLEAAAGDTPPAVILERLLALAPEVVVSGGGGGGEARDDGSSGSEVTTGVTPIQAWDQIRRRPVMGSLDLRSIMGLAEKLRDAAKCHGFGAVVDYNVFQRLVVEFMSANISFQGP